MGLFSSKKKTYVNTSFSRMIEDKDIPDLFNMAILEYTVASDIRTSLEDNSLADYVSTYQSRSIANKMRSARKWAQKKYAYGVPTSNLVVKDDVDLVEEMRAFFLDTFKEVITPEYVYIRPTNNLHMAYQILFSEYGFGIDTNNLVYNGQIWYLKDIAIKYCSKTITDLIDPDMLIPIGYAPTSGATPNRKEDRKATQTPWEEDKTAEHDYAIIYLTNKVNGQEVNTSFKIDFLKYEYSGESDSEEMGEDPTPGEIAPMVEDTNIEKDYFMMRYTDSTGRKLFTYEYGSGLYPRLDRLYSRELELGHYCPNIYFRLWGTDLTKDVYKETNEYKTSILMARKIDLDWLNVAEQLKDNIESMNDVTQMFITTVLPINTKDKNILKFMYRYFFELYRQLPNTVAESQYNSLKGDFIAGFAKTGQTVEIKDKVYTNRMSFKSIGYQDIEGVIGAKGYIDSKFSNQVVSSTRRGIAIVPSTVGVHTIRIQLTDKTYREMVIYGLSTTQIVTGGKSTTAAGNSEDLLIPVDMEILNKFFGRESNELLSKALNIVFNTVKVVKKKWYQTGIFKAIMFVAAVVISVWTGGQGMTLYAIAYAAVQAVVIGVVINLVVKFAVNQLGLNLGAVFAIVAIVVLIVGGYAAIAKTNVAGFTGQRLVAMANMSFNISNNSYQLEMKKLMKEYRKSGDLFEERMNDLNERIEELKLDPMASPLYLMQENIRGPDIRVGESMSAFITRTLSCDANLGTLSIIGNFVDLSIQLPTFQQAYYEAKPDGMEFIV